MNWEGRRVLVTGAGGFIGSHLTEHLASLGANVRAFVHYNALGKRGWLDESPVRDDLEVIAGDLADRDTLNLAAAGCDTVFHLAALIAIPYSYRAPASYVQTNVAGTVNALLAARDNGVRRFVHTSTSEVYGTAQSVPIGEDHPLQGQSPYSASKIGADKMAEAFYRSFELPVVTVRPFNTFGPRQSARAVIPTIITQALHGRTIKLGSLYPTRDLNYVTNTVEGFIAAASSDEATGHVLNLGSGREISIADLVSVIGKLLQRELQISEDAARLRPPASEVDRLLADYSRATRILKWNPRVSLEEGLTKTIAWLKERMEHYQVGTYET